MNKKKKKKDQCKLQFHHKMMSLQLQMFYLGLAFCSSDLVLLVAPLPGQLGDRL